MGSVENLSRTILITGINNWQKNIDCQIKIIYKYLCLGTYFMTSIPNFKYNCTYFTLFKY